jgi:hypothetical protein
MPVLDLSVHRADYTTSVVCQIYSLVLEQLSEYHSAWGAVNPVGTTHV